MVDFWRNAPGLISSPSLDRLFTDVRTLDSLYRDFNPRYDIDPIRRSEPLSSRNPAATDLLAQHIGVALITLSATGKIYAYARRSTLRYFITYHRKLQKNYLRADRQISFLKYCIEVNRYDLEDDWPWVEGRTSRICLQKLLHNIAEKHPNLRQPDPGKEIRLTALPGLTGGVLNRWRAWPLYPIAELADLKDGAPIIFE